MTEQINRYNVEEERFYETPIGTLKSVTTHLGRLNKPALVPWAAKMTADYFKHEIDAIVAGELDIKDMDVDDIVKKAKEYHKQIKEEAADIGSAVHAGIAAYLKTGKTDAEPSIFPMIVQALSVIQGFFRMEVDGIEMTVYHKAGYAGTLDIIGEGKYGALKKPRRIIVDVKTGTGRVYDEAKLQISAYALAYEQMTGKRVETAVVMPIDKKTGQVGTLMVLHRKTWSKYARAFVALVRYNLLFDKANK